MTGHEPRRDLRSRVLHVAHHALPHLGGLETVVEAETTRLAGRGWRVAVLSSATGTVPGEHERDGVRSVRIPAWNGMERRFGVPFPVFSPRLVTALWREVRRAQVVHIHDPLYLSSWVAALWCRVLRRPYVVHRHVGFVHHPSLVVRLVQAAVLATMARLVLERAQVVLAIDERIGRGVRERLGSSSRVRVLGNGVDTSRFHPPAPGERERLRRELGLPVEERLVLFVGRFVPKKGFPLVARAAGDRYRIVFVGGERPAGVDDHRLVFLGALAPERMPDVYRCADVMVVASVGECPLTVLEAMSTGLPVVLNEDPALHSPWTSGPGVRFVDVASGALGPTLEELVADLPALHAAGRAGHAFVRARFSWETHVDELEQVYADALRDSRAVRSPRRHGDVET